MDIFGGHHKIVVISMHFRVFSDSQGTERMNIRLDPVQIPHDAFTG